MPSWLGLSTRQTDGILSELQGQPYLDTISLSACLHPTAKILSEVGFSPAPGTLPITCSPGSSSPVLLLPGPRVWSHHQNTAGPILGDIDIKYLTGQRDM